MIPKPPSDEESSDEYDKRARDAFHRGNVSRINFFICRGSLIHNYRTDLEYHGNAVIIESSR